MNDIGRVQEKTILTFANEFQKNLTKYDKTDFAIVLRKNLNFFWYIDLHNMLITSIFKYGLVKGSFFYKILEKRSRLIEINLFDIGSI